jgi:hypothetical protein
MSDKDEAVIATAQEEVQDEQRDVIHKLDTGVRVRITPVPPGLISKAQMRIEYPKVPTFYNPDKDRTEDNPSHPDYIAECQRVTEARGMAALDAMCMFGLELVDGVPDNDTWIRKLKFVMPDFDFDESDDIAKEYYYKTLVAVGMQDFVMLAGAMGVTQEAIAQAETSFQRNSQRNGNQRASATKGRKRRDKVRS